MRRARPGQSIRTGVLVLLCAACGPGEEPAPAPGPPKSDALPAPARAHVQRALEAQRQGEIEAALQEAVAALELVPDNPSLYRLLSKLFTDAGLDEGAIAFFEEVATRYPSRPEPWLYRGFHEYHRHLWDEALRSFARAAELDPADPEPHLRRGLILQYMGRFEEALDAFRAAYAREGSAATAARVVEILRVMGRYEEAEQQAREILAREPDQSRLQLEAARLALHRGDDEAAEAHLRRALELEPTLAEARRDLAGILLRSGRAEAGRLEQLLAERLTDYVETKAFLMERLGANPEDPSVALYLAELELGGGRPDQALRWFERAARLGASPERVAAGRAETLALMGQLEGAERELLRSAGGARAELARATLLLRQGAREAALAALEQALGAPETLDRDALYRAADRLRDLGQASRWVELMARASGVARPGAPGRAALSGSVPPGAMEREPGPDR